MAEHNPIREGKPENYNPREHGVDHPAKDLKTREKVDVKESEIGRETSQMPAEEHIEQQNFQIDQGTVQLQNDKESDESMGAPLGTDSDTEEGRDNAGYENDRTGSDGKEWKTSGDEK